MTKRIRYTTDQVCDYWDGDPRLNVMSDVCWCCGEISAKLERAHIKALAAGGSDTVDNIHLLCANCHRHTEGLDGDQYWAYLAAAGWDMFGKVRRRYELLKAAGVDLLDVYGDDGVGGIVQYEKEHVSGTTSVALQLKKRAGHRLGRPVDLSQEIRNRIIREREQGISFHKIAERLIADRIPTARGGQWRKETVRAVVKSVELDMEAANGSAA